MNTRSKEIALFGNVDFQISEKLRLSMAGRSTHYDQHITSFIAGPFNGGEQFFESNAIGSPFTPKLSLVVPSERRTMYYATAAKGFRIGGVNPQIDNAQPACQAAKPGYIAKGQVFDHSFQPDSLWSYEIGAKTRLLDNRLSLDASAYHIDWKRHPEQPRHHGLRLLDDLQSRHREANGFDLGLQALLGDHVKLDATWVGRTPGTRRPFPGLVTAGEQISGPRSAVPPWTATVGAEFDFNSVNTTRTPGYRTSTTASKRRSVRPQTPADVATYNPMLPVNPQTRMVNLRLGMRLREVDASIFVNNATDEHPVAGRGYFDRHGSSPHRPLPGGREHGNQCDDSDTDSINHL